MPKCDILGVKMDVLGREQLEQAIAETIRANRKDVFAYVNVHAINIAQRDARFMNILNSTHVVYCDGEGVRLGARILGARIPPRIVLTYWIWSLCRLCESNGFSMFFLGGDDTTVAKAVEEVKKRYRNIRIAGWHHGYFEKTGVENDRVIALINRAAPNVLLVAFGMPLQEYWIEENFERLNVNAVLPAGSVIEYTGGNKGLTPSWMADHGMEWLYRLVQEPVRLWKRYLIGNPLFMGRVMAEWLRTRALS
jgi:N-acetylglucosaminyldiphosphoundecaprenol N-acetyl-beta-D-mannosaminyltransferase